MLLGRGGASTGLFVVGELLPLVSGANTVGSEGRLLRKLAAAIGRAGVLHRAGFDEPDFSYIPY